MRVSLKNYTSAFISVLFDTGHFRDTTMNLETKTARAKLIARKKPYFVRVGGAGVNLGYRRTVSGVGSWLARWSDGAEGNNQKVIAKADDAEAANGRDILSYVQAADMVRRLVRTGNTEEQPQRVVTVKDVVDAYAGGRSTKENVDRLKLHVLPQLGKRPVGALTADDLRGWQNRLTKTLAAASINRVGAVFKAALNRHADNDPTISRHAWEVGLAALGEAEQADNIVITDAQVRAVVAAAREQSTEFGLLCEVLALTGARYSQAARCRVRDLVGDTLMIPSSAKGQKRRATRVPVPISAALADKLRVAATAREAKPDDVLLVKPSGEAWAKSDHFRLWNRARDAAGLSAEASIYCLRHTSISRAILAGKPLVLICRLHDTSPAMVMRNYAAEIAQLADAEARKGMLDIDQPNAEVIPLRG
jgi:integrase